ncbi:unnamed protein product [Fraxinus pennsylvanica]|uniref:Cytochrome P450 n=1 Tax=Fraxinus pennsylvanica TaxID=56036 RepID=A0AAD2A8L6_9LAMI|nr:unnamed protein product [Fraxinus pennsylvanica]
MVNMRAITHDPNVRNDPLIFKPERYLPSAGGVNVDVRGNDLRLAPFGARIRVCPGKSLWLATVSLWVAKLVHHFEWVQNVAQSVDLSEVLNLSYEMKKPLSAVAIPRVRWRCCGSLMRWCVR